MRHTRDTNELLEVFGNQRRPIVRHDSRSDIWERLLVTLQRNLDVSFGYILPQLPVKQVSIRTVQYAYQY